MRKARFVLLLATLAGLLQAGCGDSSSDDATGSEGRSDAGTTVADVSAEDIEVGGLLAQIRGHHRAAVERYEARDRAAALKHAQHPAREVLSAVQPELEKHAPGASAALTRSLQRVAAAVNAGQPATKVEESVDAAARATLTAERQVVGETADSEAYRGSVIASIVSTAAHEYEEALAGDRVARLDEYQDGFGFVREAAAMYRSIAPLVEEQSAKEAEEIEEALNSLEKAIPSGDRPAKPAPLEDVERSATLIGAELEETVGAKLAGSPIRRRSGAKIEELLDQAVAAYEPGSPDQAAELAAEAYLENYEVIEAAVIKAAPQVNAELEPLLGAELRKQIREERRPRRSRAMVRARQTAAGRGGRSAGGRPMSRARAAFGRDGCRAGAAARGARPARARSHWARTRRSRS